MKKNGGFISTIIMIILGLAAAKYFFNWSIFEAASTPEGQGTVGYVRDILNAIWRYIGAPVIWFWNNVAEPLLDIAWSALQEILERGRGS